jgi:hypothetical protein
MTHRELAILNSLVTYAAEHIPGGLRSDEQEVAQIVGTWVIDNVPVRQICPHCGSVAPSRGEGRIRWLEHHVDNHWHRWWRSVRNVFERR